MIKGLLGRKIGMTQVFGETGKVIPVTVLRVGPCLVTRILTQDSDGYEGVQIGFEEVAERKLTLPVKGQVAQAYSVLFERGLSPTLEGYLGQAGKRVRYLREFPADVLTDHQVGEVIEVSVFEPGQHVDVAGYSKGRGFAGVVKRHGFRGGPRTHGQSDRLRAPGSIGGGTCPSKVWKGQRMAGRMGNKRVTVQNLEVVEVIPEKHLMLVRGGIPGPNNGLIQVKPAVKLGG